MANLHRLMDDGTERAQEGQERVLDRSLDRQRGVLEQLERVLPFVMPQREPEAVQTSSEPTRRDWTDTLDLVRQASESIKASEARTAQIESRTQELVERAFEELAAAKARISAAEIATADAESRHKAAEIRASEAEARGKASEAKLADTERKLKAVEARLRVAEARAESAEQWLGRVHNAVLEGFSFQPPALEAKRG